MNATAGSPGLNVAIVDVVRVLDDTTLGKAGAKQVEALYQQQQRELAPLLQQAKQKRPNDPALRSLEEKSRQFETDREKLRAQLRTDLLAKLQPVLQQIAASKGFDFVLARPQAMIFVRPELDLTSAVIAALDAAHS